MNNTKRSLFEEFGLKYLIVLIISLLGVTACQEKVDGCLDNTATNYNAIADEACESCCTFPTLSLEVAHRIRDSLVLVYGDLYELSGTDSFRVNQIKFYLSNFQLESATDTVGVLDTIQIQLRDGSAVTLEDNFSLISRDQNSPTYSLGKFSGMGTFDQISFYVGLTSIPNQTDPNSITEDHPLAIQSDSLYPDDFGAYIFNRISLVPDHITGDTVVYDIQSDQVVKVTLEYPLTIDLGFEVVVPLKIDYLEWLKGIDFAADPGEIKEVIVSNITKAFSINQ